MWEKNTMKGDRTEELGCGKLEDDQRIKRGV